MKYLVIARRYRPQRFCEVVGQGAILSTLRNALASDKAAHAYLFSGPRGVGKTTLARLFAKALNCHSPSSDFEPCNRCPSCLEILSGQSLDVIEIDGASNRGIDDIRQLNETVGYAPSGKYKIYLIDEVHMLTKEAFNALLKTLEEPPSRAKFFFATTEPHKVLPTILSRCQRFDLRRLSFEEIAQKLIFIASDLQRELAPEAAQLIAEFAEGSLRDAESLLDQILCYAETRVEASHVQEVLGLVPQELFFSLDAAFHEGRTAFAFELAEQIFQMGKDLSHFAEQLILHYRRLAMLRMTGSSTEPRIEASARLYTQQQLLHILDLLLNSYAGLQKSPMQRVHLESMLLGVLRSRQRVPIEVLVRRLSELEQKLLEQPPAKNSDSSPQEPVLKAPIAPPQEPFLKDLSLLSPKTIEPLAAQLVPEQKREPTLTDFSPAPFPKVEEPKKPRENLAPIDQKPEPALKPVPFEPHRVLKDSPELARTLLEGKIDPLLDDVPLQAGKNLPAAEKASRPEPFSGESLSSQNQQSDFKVSLPKEASPHLPEIKAPSPPSQTIPRANQTDYETLLRFAAIELEGTVKGN